MYDDDFSVNTMKPSKGGGRKNKQTRKANKVSVYSSGHVRRQLVKSTNSKNEMPKKKKKKKKKSYRK